MGTCEVGLGQTAKQEVTRLTKGTSPMNIRFGGEPLIPNPAPFQGGLCVLPMGPFRIFAVLQPIYHRSLHLLLALNTQIMNRVLFLNPLPKVKPSWLRISAHRFARLD